MTNNFNVSISGGAASVGNIVQGDNNQVSANISTKAVGQAFHKARSEISTLGHELKLPKDQVGDAVQNLEKLAGEAKAGAPTPEKGAAIIKTIRDNYSWAYPLFKDFISVAWPALLTLIKA